MNLHDLPQPPLPEVPFEPSLEPSFEPPFETPLDPALQQRGNAPSGAAAEDDQAELIERLLAWGSW